MNKLLASIVMLISFSAYGQEVAFNCSGTNRILSGENIYAPKAQSDVRNFDIAVNTKEKFIYGYPVYVNLACSEESSKMKCSMDSMAVQCSCESDIATSRMTLSRNTGAFKVVETYKKSGMVQEGTYACNKMTKKVF